MADKFDPKTIVAILGGDWNCATMSASTQDKHHSLMVHREEEVVELFQHLKDGVNYRTWGEVQVAERIMARMHEKLREKGYKTK